jgi:predicted nucleic acid-binding protein
MAIYLLDTSVIVDTLSGRRGRRELLAGLLRQGNILTCCTVNIIEVYTGTRPHEERATDEFLGSLGYLEVTWPIARRAGRLRYEWARKGRTLSLADATIAAVVLAHGFTLMTDNVRHFPMPELQMFSMPE